MISAPSAFRPLAAQWQIHHPDTENRGLHVLCLILGSKRRAAEGGKKDTSVLVQTEKRAHLKGNVPCAFILSEARLLAALNAVLSDTVA